MQDENMKILIAEDERDVASAYRIVLEERNHELVVTDNGEACLEVYREKFRNSIAGTESTNNQQDLFDRVILDYKMPGMNGIEVAKEILKTNPKQRIIICSAYPVEAFSDSLKHLGQSIELMQKPFDIDALINIGSMKKNLTTNWED
jgi:CheY-like chemotaxis protein